MHLLKDGISKLHPWIRKEVEHEKDLAQGQKGAGVKRVQEWLTIHGFKVAVDKDFGPATKLAVERFQTSRNLPVTGIVDAGTFGALVEPMLAVLKPLASVGEDLPSVLLAYARAHLAVHPVEAGGDNQGPWVRLYMKGNEGADWRWCAGFACFVMDQAAQSLGVAAPIKGSFSCDSVAAQGKEVGRFLPEAKAKALGVPPGSFFLVRRTDTDWIHMGIVTDPGPRGAETFDTIEGNTNNEGSANGFEVAAMARGYKKKDIVLLG